MNTCRAIRYVLILFMVGWALPMPAQTNALRIGTTTVSPLTPSTVGLIVDGVAAEPIGGLSFGVPLPAGVGFEGFLAVDSEFVGIQSGVGFVAIGILFSTTGIAERGPGFLTFGTLSISFPSLAPGATIELPIVDGLGSPPISVEFATTSGALIPLTLPGAVVAATAPVSQVWITSATTDEVQPIDTAGVAGAAIPSGGFLDPHSAAVDANGIVWVSYRGSGIVRRFDPSGVELFVFGTLSRIETTGTPEGIAIDRHGNGWIANPSDSTVSQVDSFGRVIFGGDGPPIDSADDGILGPAIALSAPPRAIAADAAGSVWVVCSDGAASSSVARINRSGNVAFDLDLGGTDPVDVAVDPDGFAWIALGDAGSVERRSSDGAVVETFAIPSPSAITVRRNAGVAGGREAWVVGNDTGVDKLYRLRTGGTIDTFDTPGGDAISGVVIDGAGRPWITSPAGTARQLDPASVPPGAPTVTSTVTSLAGAEVLGDASGYTQASVHFPDGDPATLSFFDFDADGFVNLVELDAGTDVFAATSTPPIVVIPVQGLQCTNDGLDVTLSWSDAQSYDEVRIFVDAVLETTLIAGEETASFTLSDDGTFLIEVIAAIVLDESTPSSCTVTAGTGDLTSTTTIVEGGDQSNPFDLAVTDQLGPCVPTFLVTDPEARQVLVLDETELVIDSFSSDIFDGDFGATGVAFDPFGNSSQGSVYLTGGAPGEQVEIIEVDLAGQPVAGQVHLFATDAGSPILGTPGSLTMSSVLGGNRVLLFTGPDGCSIFALSTGSPDPNDVIPSAGFVHPTLAPFGLNGLEIVGPYDEAGGTVWVTETTAAEGEYQVGEIAASGGIGTQTGQSISLAEVDEDNVLGGFVFLENEESGVIELSVIGITTSSLYGVEASQLFVRGDANDDGTVNIADVIAILDILFASVTPITCGAALDANGDGVTDIADGIYLLTFLFSSGPPPPPPFPDAGGDLLECS